MTKCSADCVLQDACEDRMLRAVFNLHVLITQLTSFELWRLLRFHALGCVRRTDHLQRNGTVSLTVALETDSSYPRLFR
jgi:hypothetical protein